MSDPGLLSISSEPGGLQRWAFTHNLDHNRLITAANTKYSGHLEFRILDPISLEFDDWLLDHQRAHDDLASFTGVDNSDLQSVNFKDPAERDAWLLINQQEHAAFAAVLGV